MNRFDCSIWLPSPNNERLSKWRLNPAWKRFIPLFCKIIVHTYLETRKSMVTFPICTLAIHPFIWGGADVAVLLPMDSWYASPWCDISCSTHIYSVPFTHNTTLTPDIYFLYLVTRRRDVFVSWSQAEGLKRAWRTLITNLQLPEITKGGESSNWRRNPIAFLIKLWPRCERDI